MSQHGNTNETIETSITEPNTSCDNNVSEKVNNHNINGTANELEEVVKDKKHDEKKSKKENKKSNEKISEKSPVTKSAASKSNKSDNKAIEVTTNHNNLNINDSYSPASVSPNSLGVASSVPVVNNNNNNNNNNNLRFVSFIPAQPAGITNKTITQQNHIDLNVSNNTTSSISPQQWSPGDAQLPSYIPTTQQPYHINSHHYDPQYAAYQNLNYTNFIPIEYAYPLPLNNAGHSQTNNDSNTSTSSKYHSRNLNHHGSRVHTYENGVSINPYYQFVPTDGYQHLHHMYADDSYQAGPVSNAYSYKKDNRSFNRHNKYNSNETTTNSSSGNSKTSSSSNKTEALTNKNSTKNITTNDSKEEINDTPAKQAHKWSDIVSGKNNKNDAENGTNESINNNRVNQDEQSGEYLENATDYYNKNSNIHKSNYHAKSSNHQNNFVDSNNNKYHNSHKYQSYLHGYGLNNQYVITNQYGLDAVYQENQFYNSQYPINLNLLNTDFTNLNLISPASLYNNTYNNSFLNYAMKPKKTYENNKYHLNNNKHHSNSPTIIGQQNAAVSDKFNPTNFLFNGEQENERSSRFFVIKSYSKEDVIHSIKNNIWCSTENGNSKLDDAFKRTINQKHMSIYLFFSVNGSGQFCGMAEMVSSVDYKSSSQLWTQNKWKGKFDVKWIFVKDVPNVFLRQIHLPNNENKSVTNSRDTQEILYDQAIQVMDVFRKCELVTTILDEADTFEPITYFNRKEYEPKKTSYDNKHENSSKNSSNLEPTVKKILTKSDNKSKNNVNTTNLNNSSEVIQQQDDNLEKVNAEK